MPSVTFYLGVDVQGDTGNPGKGSGGLVFDQSVPAYIDPSYEIWRRSGDPFGSVQEDFYASGSKELGDSVPGLAGLSIVQPPVGLAGGAHNQFGIAGIPETLGVFNVTFDATAQYAGEIWTITIALAAGCPLISIFSDDPPNDELTIGLAMSLTIQADNGVAPYTWDVIDGAVPPGLTLSTDGLLSGTPTTAGEYRFVVRATDNNGCCGVGIYTFTVNGLQIFVASGSPPTPRDHTVDILQADFTLGLNQRSTARLVFGENFIPDREAEVTLYARDGLTAVFGGIILRRHVRGLEARGLPSGTEAECVDFSVYFDSASVTLSYDAPVAVEDVITDVVDQVLGDYGLTYTPTATGRTMDAFSVTDVVVTTLFQQISDKTGIVFRTTPTKEILAFLPGADAAPIEITDSNLEHFDLAWTDGDRLTANTVELFCGPTGPGLMSQQWVADGVETSWVTDLPAIDPAPILVEVDDGVTPRLATVVPAGGGSPSAGQFEWDRDTHTLSLGTDPVPSAGTILRLGVSPNFDTPFTYYTVQFPFKVTRPVSPPTPRIVYRENRPDCVEYAAGVEIAEGLLERESADRRDAEIATDVDGFLPGQRLTMNTTSRGGLVADFIVASVQAHVTDEATDKKWDYIISVQEAALGSPQTGRYRGTYVDQWKALTDGSTSDAPTTVTAPGGVEAAVEESDLSLSDVTTADVSTTKHGFAPKAPGDATKFLNGANPPAWVVPSGSSSKILQVVKSEDGAVATGTTQIPFDNTIPQNTEGDQYLSVSITPTNSSNILCIEVVAFLTSTTTPWVAGALFQDSTANALAAIPFFVNLSTTGQPIVLRHYMVAGTTSATTFKFRAGPSNAATVTFNGQSGGRIFGGVMASSISVTELTP